MAHQIHEIGGVLTVVNRERRVDTDLRLPGGDADWPIEVASASVVEVRARGTACVQCRGDLDLRGDRASSTPRGVLRQVLEIATNMGFSSSILSINKAGDEQKPIVLMDIRFHGHLPLRELVPYLLDVPGVQSVTVRGTDPNEDDDDPSA